MSKSKSKMKRWSRAWNANFLRMHTQFTYYTKTQRNRRAALLWQLTFHFDSRLLLIFCDIQINNDAHFTFRWGFECSFRPIFTQICVYIYVCKRTLARSHHHVTQQMRASSFIRLQLHTNCVTIFIWLFWGQTERIRKIRIYTFGFIIKYQICVVSYIQYYYRYAKINLPT